MAQSSPEIAVPDVLSQSDWYPHTEAGIWTCLRENCAYTYRSFPNYRRVTWTGTYMIANPDGFILYIGSSHNLARRVAEHLPHEAMEQTVDQNYAAAIHEAIQRSHPSQHAIWRFEMCDPFVPTDELGAWEKSVIRYWKYDRRHPVLNQIP